MLVDVVRELEGSASVAGPVALFGLLSAFWASSGYIGGFIRASNAIYEIEEGGRSGRPFPLRLALTLTMVILLAVTVLGVVVTGGVAEWLGDPLGLGSTGVRCGTSRSGRCWRCW